MLMIINGIEFKPYDDNYYVSKRGDVYSVRTKKMLKHYIDADGYHRVDLYKKHKKVHKLVYITWIGNIPDGKQINHKDDNKDNNDADNLYAGTQTENINDCIQNNHRKGNLSVLIVRKKTEDKILIFQPAVKFFEYCGHTAKNGGISRAITRDWFKKEYELIAIRKGVTTIESY